MSTVSRMIISAALAVKNSGLRRMPEMNEAEMERIHAWNRKHSYVMPNGRKGRYSEISVCGFPCLVIHPKRREGEGKIIYLHGGGDKDVWNPEVSFAAGYADRTGKDVYYPLYPPMTEMPLEQCAEEIYSLYCSVCKAGKCAVVGCSYGGFLALQLLDRINRYGKAVRMPELMILNSPYAFFRTEEEKEKARGYGRKDPFVPEEAMEYMEWCARYPEPEIPECLLYPEKMDLRSAPKTLVYYAEETLAALADPLKRAYEKAGRADRLQLKITPGVMHCYACAPVFKESRRDHAEQITAIKEAL